MSCVESGAGDGRRHGVTLRLNVAGGIGVVRRAERRNMLFTGTSMLAAASLQSAAPITTARAQQSAPVAGAAGTPPNILVIMADDIGYWS
jgi:hypothetical protein